MRGIGPSFLALAALVVVVACEDSTQPGPSEPPPTDGDSVIVAVAGDIACGSATPTTAPCRQAETAGLVALIDPDAVLVLGDLQYEDGSLDDFNTFYDPTWGIFKSITYPIPGNHEYETPSATGYFDYMDGVGAQSGRAGDRGRGYYAVTLGSWRIIALNSECDIIGGCGPGSTQEQWLRSELAANSATCTLAMWHRARFSSSNRAEDLSMVTAWQLLASAGADVVLSAHSHNYERFAPLLANGTRDDANGMRSFVVGTGGKDLHGFVNPHPSTEIRDHTTFGVLKLVLRESSYAWEFVPVDEGGFTDVGEANCR